MVPPERRSMKSSARRCGCRRRWPRRSGSARWRLLSVFLGEISLREGGVPDLDGWYLLIVTKHAQRAGVEQEMLPRARRQGDPARREHAQNVSVRKQSNVAGDLAHARD